MQCTYIDTKLRKQIDVTDLKTQQASAAILAAVLRRDPEELRRTWMLVAAAVACHWAGDISDLTFAASHDHKACQAE